MIKSLTFVAVFVHFNLLYPAEGCLQPCVIGKHDALYILDVKGFPRRLKAEFA